MLAALLLLQSATPTSPPPRVAAIAEARARIISGSVIDFKRLRAARRQSVTPPKRVLIEFE